MATVGHSASRTAGGVLVRFGWPGGQHSLSMHVTGHFLSPTVHCANSAKECRWPVEYHDRSVCAVLAHP